MTGDKSIIFHPLVLIHWKLTLKMWNLVKIMLCTCHLKHPTWPDYSITAITLFGPRVRNHHEEKLKKSQLMQSEYQTVWGSKPQKPENPGNLQKCRNCESTRKPKVTHKLTLDAKISQSKGDIDQPNGEKKPSHRYY